MSQLAAPRIGWENEHLAAFLLSRIAFVAQPVSVGDDIGMDFICTLLEVRKEKSAEMLYPRNSMVVQVKTGTPKKVKITGNKIVFWEKLELPYFLGFVIQDKLEMHIYSGEYLPIALAQLDVRQNGLVFHPCETASIKNYYTTSKSGKHQLKFPFLLTLKASDNKDETSQSMSKMLDLCSRIHTNISSRKTNEHIYKINEPPIKSYILAGPGSAQTFRNNFALRLAEAFENLGFILRCNPNSINQIKAEYQIYEKCYLDLLALHMPMPEEAQQCFSRAKQAIEGKAKPN